MPGLCLQKFTACHCDISASCYVHLFPCQCLLLRRSRTNWDSRVRCRRRGTYVLGVSSLVTIPVFVAGSNACFTLKVFFYVGSVMVFRPPLFYPAYLLLKHYLLFVVDCRYIFPSLAGGANGHVTSASGVHWLRRTCCHQINLYCVPEGGVTNAIGTLFRKSFVDWTRARPI